MSSTPPATLLKICHFEGPFLPLQPYFCYKNEVCCKDGCCSPYERKYFQSWHFWYKIYILLGLIFILLLYRYVCWYCSKYKRNRNNRMRQRDEDNINPRVVNLMVSYSNRNVASADPKDDDPPPLYNVAINLPKPTNHDQVPTYEQATSQRQ